MVKYAWVFLLLLFIACDKFDYNVYETGRIEKDQRSSTEYNLSRLFSLPEKDTLHVVFIGDTQRFYDEVEDLVDAVNNLPEVDAVIITGDLADFAVEREYIWLNDELKKLKVPFLTVIGNHDCLANGTELYQSIYGPLNYSFTWNDIRFVMVNTNSREFDFSGSVPDIGWMEQQLVDSVNYNCCVFVCHVPPFCDDFDNTLEQPFTSLVSQAKNTVFTVNGHRHNEVLDQPYDDGIWYLNTSAPVNRIYSLVTIYPYAKSQKKFDNRFVPF